MTDPNLGYAFIKAADTNPDQYARALTLAQPRQAPPLAVLSNLPEAERLEKIDRLRSAIGDAPKLQQALKDDPDLLFLASDSIEPLSTLERLGDVGRSFMSGGARTIYQPLSAAYEATAAAGTALGNMFTGDLPAPTDGTPDVQWLREAVSHARQVEARREGLEAMPGFSAIQQALQNVDANDAAWYRRNLATDIAGAAGSLTGQLATAGGGRGLSILSLLGQGYQQGVENAQESGVYGTDRGDLGALLTAGVTGASEQIGLDLLTRPLARTGIAGRLAGLALGASGEGLSEGAEQFGQNLVQRYVMGDQSIDPFAGVGYNAFLGLVTGGLFRAGVETAAMAKERADKTTARNQALAQGLTDVMNSPFAKRSPEAATALAGKLLATDPDGSITLPAEQARVLFQADDGAFLPPDLQEEVNRKITAGLASGADIDIPISVLAHAAQAGKIEQVLQSARLADGDMTGAEAAKVSQADIGEEGRRLAQEMLNSIEPEDSQASVDRIQAEIAQQLEATGTAPDVAAQYAGIEAQRMLSRAQRRGSDVDTIADETGLRFVGEFEGLPEEGRTLNQDAEEERPATEKFKNDAKRWGDLIIGVASGKVPLANDLRLGRTPQVLRHMGVDNSGLIMVAGKSAKAMFRDHPEIPGGVWVRLPQLISDPRYIFPSTSRDGALVVALDAVDKNGDPIIVAILPGGSDQQRQLRNIVLSVYGKAKAGEKSGEDWIQDNVKAAQKRGDTVYARDGLVPLAESTKPGSTTKAHPMSQDPRQATPAVGTKGNIISRADVVKSRGGMFYQPDGSGTAPRGSVTFTGTGSIIRLFEHRNLSTVLHELGHTWLEELRYDASLPEAPDQLKADWLTVQKHLGLDTLSEMDDIPTEAHETFARSAEAYFMEGKAPSLPLAGAFNRFRAWLTNIYRNVRNLNVTMTPEIRGVFDRLLATDDQIAAMQASEAWTTLDQTLLDAGLTDAERKRYVKLSGEARDEAERAVMNKVMAEVRADHKQTLKDMRPQIREQVEQDANTDQHLLAVEWIKENGPLSRTAVEDVLGADGAKGLQRGLVKKGGADPEMVAPLLGYESGAEMLRALAQTPTRKQWVEAETERRLAEAFPDPIVTGEAQNAGWAAIHSDKRAEVLALELKALKKLKAGQIVKKGVERQGLGQSTRTGKEGRQETDAEVQALEATDSDQTRGGDATAQAAQLNADAVRSTDNARRREAYAAEQRWKSELAALAENAQAVRVAAQNAASQMTVADLLRTDRHRSAEAKAAAEVQQALTRRDFEAAIEAKTRQIYAHHLARASAEAREATQKQIKKFARVLSDRVKMNIDPDYRARARQLLSAYDFGPKLSNRQQMLLELQAFNEWMQAKQQDDAAQFVIPERILRAQQLTNYRDMTYADFQALGDSVDNVITQGRLKNRLLAERDKIALDQARAELANTARQNVRENGRPEIGTERFQRLRDTLRGVLSSLKKTETLVKELDGGKENGPWAQLIYKPLSDAADAETTRKAAAVKDLQNLFSVFSKADLKAMNTKISVPELNGSLSKWELLSLALNAGNESSLEALTEGYKIQPETVTAVIDRYLTKRDMDFVQSVWNYVNSFWPEIAAQEKRLTGVEPAKVEATPLQTSHGTYAGGYYPLKYRSDSKPNSAAQIAEENYRQMIGGGVNRAATRHGHTIERQGSGGRRVALDIGILFGHIDSVIHDLTHREAVIDTHRLLTGGNVHQALVNTVGQEGFQAIDQTIRAVAGGQVAPTDDLQKIVQYVRGGTVIRALGLNLANALQNLTGVLPATALVGEKRMAMHALPFLARPDQWRAQMAWIRGKSPMMAARLQNFDRDVFQFGASLDPRRARRIKFQSWVNAPVAYTDNLTAGAVWIAAYNKAMGGEAGVNAEDSAAVAYADSVVRRSLSSGRQLDLAQVQRGNEYMKLLTTFIGYFQAIYNLNVENVKNLQQGNIGATRAAMNLLLINVIPATIGQAMLGGPDDDESWWHWLAFANLRWLTGGIPLVRDLASVAQFGSAAKSPIAQVGEDFGRAGQGIIRMFTDDDVTRAQYRGMVNTVGTLAHLPTNQAWKTGDALLRWMEGEDGIGLYDAVVGAPPKK